MASSRAVQVDDFAMDASKLGVSFAPIHEDFGADVSGMDLSGGISDTQGALIKDALDRFTLLRFRQQTLEPADEAKLLSFLPHDEEGMKNGTFKSNFPSTIPGYPWLAVVPVCMGLKDYYGLNTETPPMTPIFKSRLTWHIDLSHQPCPAMYSYMYMKISPSEGADTVFTSAVKAYSMLTDEQKRVAHKLRKRCYKRVPLFRIYSGPNAEYALAESGLRYENPSEMAELAQGDNPDEPFIEDFRGPFVIEEEGTGVRSINASPLRIHSFEGMSPEESHELLEEFLAPATAPERVWSADWQPGYVVVWKNRHLIHSGPPRGSYTEPRLSHLVFWESDVPVQAVNDPE